MNKKSVTSLSLRKLLLSALVAAPLATLPSSLWALPSTASSNVTSSAGTSTTFSTVGSTILNVNTPDRTILTWGAFGVAGGETVNFNLPTTSSAVLNRVTGGAVSTIAGQLNSNGRLYLLNPAGITLTSTGSITAAGVGLSTIDEPDYNFAATGSLNYIGPATTGDIDLQGGTILVGSSGTVALNAQDISITGTIDAGTLNVSASNSGNVALSGGAVDGTTGLTVGNAASKYGNATITTTGGSVDVGSNLGNVLIAGGSLTVNTASGATAGGAISKTAGAAGLYIGNGTDAGSVSLTTKGSSSSGAVTIGEIGANGAKQLNVTLNTGVTGLIDPSGDIQLNAGSSGSLSVTATSGNIKSGGNVTAATVTLLSAVAGNITYAAAGNTTFTTITIDPTKDLTISGTGTLSVPAFTATNATLGGTSLTQTGAGFTVTGTATIQPTTNATLTTATNNFATVVLKNISGNASVTDAGSITVGTGTNVTGNATITANAGAAGGTLALGTAAADTINVNGNLTLVATGAGAPTIIDGSDNITVLGGLVLTATANNVTLDGATGNGVGIKNQYGAVSGAANNLTIFEQTGLNLGAITAASLNAYSATSISNTGKLAITGALTVGAGTASAPGAIALNYTNSTVGSGNQIAGAIRIQTDLGLLGLGSVGNYLASSLTVVNESAFNVAIPANIYGAGMTGDVSLTSASTNGIANIGLLATDAIVISGNLSLTQPAATASINLANTNNRFGAVTVTSAGDVTNVNAASAFTVNATLTEGAAGKVANFTSADALTLGTITSNFTGAAGVTFTAGATKAITDSVAGIGIFGATSFSGGSLSITRAGHSFGTVAINTAANNGNATISEAGTLRLGTVATGSGSLTATSQSGSVIQLGSAAGIVTTGNVTVSGASGVVTLDDVDNNFGGTVSLTATGNSSVISNNNNITLGNVVVSNGTFTATTGFAGGNVTQATGTTVNTFGATAITANAAGNITLGNTGNRFGALSLTTTSGNITVTEQTTMNLKVATTTGNATFVSEGGSIVDSGALALGTGTTTLTANAGNITLANTGSNFATISLTTGGNASLVDGTANLALGGSTIGGTLMITQTAGNITQAPTGPAVVVAGDTTLNATAGGSSIILNNSANQFGALQFLVGTGGAIIDEVTTMNLRAGTVATGQVTLNTGGNFVTSGVGASQFLGATSPSLTINAPTGTITPGTGSLVVLNGLRVISSNTINLIGLSKSGNLYNIDPTHPGSGAYTAPSP